MAASWPSRHQRAPHGRAARPRSSAPAIRLCAAALALAVATPAPACGYHDPSSVALGMLNLAYPDSLHVRTAVWTAQLEGTLDRAEPTIVGSASPDELFRRTLRLRQTLARLDALRGQIDAALDGAPPPAFSIVLIGPMLWSRFEAQDGALKLSAHSTGPDSGDVVIVTDEPVVAALLEGRISPPEARERGLLRVYGEADNATRLMAVFDRRWPTPHRITQQVSIGREN
jgi:hypothetical protein